MPQHIEVLELEVNAGTHLSTTHLFQEVIMFRIQFPRSCSRKSDVFFQPAASLHRSTDTEVTPVDDGEIAHRHLLQLLRDLEAQPGQEFRMQSLRACIKHLENALNSGKEADSAPQP